MYLRQPTEPATATAREAARRPARAASGIARLRAIERSVLVLALWLPAAASALDREAYRADLVGLMHVVADIRMRAGPEAPGSIRPVERAATLFAGLGDAQVDALDAHLPAARLHAIVAESRRLLQAPPKEAIAYDPDVSPAFCSDYPAPVALAALGTKLVTRFVIESLEFSCSETIAGENTALACEAPEIAAASADVASRLADFCGDQQSAATNQAVLLTERSIGRHLETQLDATLSSRATQLTLDAASGIASANAGRVDELGTQAGQDAVRIESGIEDAAGAQADLADDIARIQRHADDLVFRLQVVQASLEDAQVRSVDLHAKSQELEAALGDADARIAVFALPVAAGGRLEDAREVLIDAIAALQALGQGDTSTALARLAEADAHYNAHRYADAWRQFGAAYRALDPHVGAPREAPR